MWLPAHLRSPAVDAAVAVTYATWNPADKSANYTLSNGNLTATQSAASNWCSIRSTIGKSSGKWYWEQTANSTAGSTIMLGIGTAAFSLAGYAGQLDAFGWSVYGADGNKRTNGGTTVAYGATWTYTDVMGVALDMDAGTVTIYKNNVSQGVMYSGLSGTMYAASSTHPQNGAFTTNFGASAFTYSPPSGFNAGLYA